MIRAVILAAGRGSRMGHLGNDRPKCLVELEGKPLIERQIAALRPIEQRLFDGVAFRGIAAQHCKIITAGQY